jgi:hypothetical protein
MLGSLAEQAIQEALRPLEKTSITIRKYRYIIFMNVRQTSRPRISIRCKPLPFNGCRMYGVQAAHLSEIIKLTVTITASVKEITPFALQTTGVISFIFSSRHNGLQYQTPVTVATLDASVRIWLGRKGFGSDEVIRKLEDLAGTFTYGLMMLL